MLHFTEYWTVRLPSTLTFTPSQHETQATRSRRKFTAPRFPAAHHCEKDVVAVLAAQMGKKGRKKERKKIPNETQFQALIEDWVLAGFHHHYFLRESSASLAPPTHSRCSWLFCKDMKTLRELEKNVVSVSHECDCRSAATWTWTWTCDAFHWFPRSECIFISHEFFLFHAIRSSIWHCITQRFFQYLHTSENWFLINY